MTLQIARADEYGGLGTFGPVILNIVKRPLTLSWVRQSFELTQQLAKKGGPVGSVSIIAPEAVEQQAEGDRDEVNKMMLQAPLAAATFVFEGSGFRVATARTVVAGYFIIKRPYPFKVANDVATGLTWLAGELRQRGATDLEAAKLRQAFEELRGRLSGGATAQR